MNTPFECESTTERIISIPISVVDQLTTKFVKDAIAQLKIRRENSDLPIHLVVACEEGIFSQTYEESDLKQCITKPDLEVSTWLSVLTALLETNIYVQPSLPSEYNRVVLNGKLYSLDEYDPESGQLLKAELGEVAPQFELYVKTEGMLSVVLGMLPIQNQDPEECSADESDMLSWLLILTSQIESLRKTHFQLKLGFESVSKVADMKEQEITEVTTDYQKILEDLQDRFFQVLAAKKKKIRELEGEDSSSLKLLNFEYVERSKLNLNRVRIEDIQIGENSKQYSERRKRRKVEPAKKSRKANTPQSSKQDKKVKQDDKTGGSGTDEIISEKDENEIKIKLEDESDNDEIPNEETTKDDEIKPRPRSTTSTQQDQGSSDDMLSDSEQNTEDHDDGESTEYSE